MGWFGVEGSWNRRSRRAWGLTRGEASGGGVEKGPPWLWPRVTFLTPAVRVHAGVRWGRSCHFFETLLQRPDALTQRSQWLTPLFWR